MSILLNSPKRYSSLQDLINRIFDVCPSMDILHRDPEDKANQIVRVADRGFFFRQAPSAGECLERLDTVVNLDYFSCPRDINATVFGFMQFADEYLPDLRRNHGIWVNLIPDVSGKDRIALALDSAMTSIIESYSKSEERRFHTGEYVSFINIRLANGCEWFNAEQTCLFIDYLSKYRDILVNMPGKELRLF